MKYHPWSLLKSSPTGFIDYYKGLCRAKHDTTDEGKLNKNILMPSVQTWALTVICWKQLCVGHSNMQETASCILSIDPFNLGNHKN